MTLLHRRKFLIGLITAPAIVHAGNLMPIKAIKALKLDVGPYYYFDDGGTFWTFPPIHNIAPGNTPFLQSVLNDGPITWKSKPWGPPE